MLKITNSTSLLLSIVIITMLSCSNSGSNQLSVVAKLNDKPSQGIRVTLKELFPIEGVGTSTELTTDQSGKAIFEGLKDDMYEVWVAYPGFEEVRQRVPLSDGSHITLKTSLKKKMLPSNFKRIYAYGTFNSWNQEQAVELQKAENGIWEATIDSVKADSISYFLYFDKPYMQFYNPHSSNLLYLPGHQPPFQSIEYKKNGKFRIQFSGSDFLKSDTPFLSHWIERDIEGMNAQEYILFEKLMTENFQLLSKILFDVTKIQSIPIKSRKDKDLVKAQLDSINSRNSVKRMLEKIYNFSEEYDGPVYDLAKIELAKIYWILGQIGNAHKTSDLVDLNSFAGGEAYQISTSSSMRIPRGFSEYTRKKLKVVKNRKTRFVLREKLALAYSVLDDKKEEYRMALQGIIDEFPETELASSAKKTIAEMDEEKESDNSQTDKTE